MQIWKEYIEKEIKRVEVMDSSIKERVEKELEDLRNKENKLSNFIYSDKLEALSKESQFLLNKQVRVMREYIGILEQRIELDRRERDNG